MFIAVRDAKCSRLRRSRAGHDVFSQRQTTSSSSRCSALPHTGHARRHLPRLAARRAVRMRQDRLDDLRDDVAGLSRSARGRRRGCPCARCPRRCAASPSRWSMPASITGSSTAYGVTAPVRPTLTSIACSVVVACCAGNLKAVAQRGNFAVAPSRSRSARSSTLITTPSVSNSSAWRLSAHSAQKATTSSMLAQRRQCGSTGRPHAAQRGQRVARGEPSATCRRLQPDRRRRRPADRRTRPGRASTTSAGSRFRIVPAAALRGLANSGSPASSARGSCRSNDARGR